MQFQRIAPSKFSFFTLNIEFYSFIFEEEKKIGLSVCVCVWGKRTFENMIRRTHPAQHKNKCYCRKSICDCFEIDDSRENAIAGDFDRHRSESATPLRPTFVPTDVNSEASFTRASASDVDDDDDEAIDDSECHYSWNGAQYRNRW